MRRLRNVVDFGERHPGMSFLIAAVALVFAVLALGVGYVYPKVQAANAAQQQQQQLADTLCGGFVPISQEPVTPRTTPLGLSIIDWAKQGTDRLNCPAQGVTRP